MKWILTCLAFAFSFSLVACQGDEGAPVDYGPAVPQASIDKALNAPLANVDPLKIQLGQFTDIIQSQTIAAKAYQTTGEVGTTVVALDDQATQIVFTIIEKTVSYSDNKIVARELTRIAQKPPIPAVVTPQQSAQGPRLNSHWYFDVFSQNRKDPFINNMILFMNKYLTVLAETPMATKPTSFHNLSIHSSAEAPPAAVQKQTNCGDVPGCKINLTKVSFDMLVWSDPSGPDKIHREFLLSPDVPYFANVMSECDSLLVPVGNMKTLVTLCSDVVNFRYATPQ